MQFRQVHAAYLALQERAPDEATHTRGNARNENNVQNERQEQQMPTFEDSLRAFHSAFGNAQPRAHRVATRRTQGHSLECTE